MHTNTKIAIGAILLFFAIFFSIKIGLGNMADSVSGFFAEQAEKGKASNTGAQEAMKKSHKESMAKQNLIDRMANDIESLEDEIKDLQQSLTLKEKEVLAQAKELDKAKRAERKEVVEGDEDPSAVVIIVAALLVMFGCFCAGVKIGDSC